MYAGKVIVPDGVVSERVEEARQTMGFNELFGEPEMKEVESGIMLGLTD
jgi:hypothetical protein